MNQKVQTAERFVRLIDAVNQVQHLQAEVNNEDIEQVHCNSIDATHVDDLFTQPGQRHIEQHDPGNPRYHGREDEHYRHQRRRPPGICLDGAEDKPDVAVQQKCGRNSDQRNNPAHPLIDRQRPFADVVRAQRHHPVNQAQQAFARLRKQHDLAPVIQPYLEHQHGHQVPHIHIAEHGHGRGAVRSEVHLRRAERVAQVQDQRQGRNQQEGEGRQQRQPVSGLDRFHAEDPLQRRQNECSGHQSRDKRVQNDQHAPLECDFVRIHEAFNTAHNLAPSSQPSALSCQSPACSARVRSVSFPPQDPTES